MIDRIARTMKMARLYLKQGAGSPKTIIKDLVGIMDLLFEAALSEELGDLEKRMEEVEEITKDQQEFFVNLADQMAGDYVKEGEPVEDHIS